MAGVATEGRLVEGRQQIAGYRRRDAAGNGMAQEGAHRLPLVHESTDVALGLGQSQGALERRERAGDVAPRLVRERLQHQDFDDASRSLSGVRRVQEPLQECDSPRASRRSSRSRRDWAMRTRARVMCSNSRT